MPVRLRRYMECSGVIPTNQFTYRKVLGSCDALLCVADTLQSALEMGQEAIIIQIDFSAAFNRINHERIVFKLHSDGVGGIVWSVLTKFLSNRSLCVMVDGCRSKLVNMVSGVLPFVNSGAFLYSGKQELRLCRRLNFGSCCAISC